MGVVLIALLVLFIKMAYIWVLRKITRPTFEGKLIWLTGASSGIGKQLAKDLSALGASLILSSRKANDLEKVKNECAHPEKIRVVPIDFSNSQEVLTIGDNVVKQCEERGEKIDILIENAGVSMRTAFIDFDFENHKYMTELNYNGPVAHVKAVLPHLIANKSGQIVLVNSISGLLAPALRTSYSGTKHALRGFFDSLRSEVKEYNIDVTTIYPGYVQTGVSQNSLTSKKGETLGKVDDNIKNGETVEEFCQQMIIGIYKKHKDMIITKSLTHQIGVMLRNISFDLVHYFTYKNMKSQLLAVKKAE